MFKGENLRDFIKDNFNGFVVDLRRDACESIYFKLGLLLNTTIQYDIQIE